ncbi:hypothetical protein SO802_001543 [Lithocarpus litseifolius]|uniref:Uncharacterized protein n=1 Tax=Lithocarpus litseifolius TaxID=425828 RepID=A0AAW2DWJ3_9ROSI
MTIDKSLSEENWELLESLTADTHGFSKVPVSHHFIQYLASSLLSISVYWIKCSFKATLLGSIIKLKSLLLKVCTMEVLGVNYQIEELAFEVFDNRTETRMKFCYLDNLDNESLARSYFLEEFTEEAFVVEEPVYDGLQKWIERDDVRILDYKFNAIGQEKAALEKTFKKSQSFDICNCLIIWIGAPA